MATLTPAQQQTLKTFITTDPVLGPISSGPGTDANAITAALNADSAFVVWRSTTAVDAVRNAIDWAKMTPAQTPDTTVSQTNRFLVAQAKQINLNTLLAGTGPVVSGLVNIRAAFNDCLTALPTKNDGTNQAAGWTAVQTAMQRNATVAEEVLASGAGTAATPGTLGWEGVLSISDVGAILA